MKVEEDAAMNQTRLILTESDGELLRDLARQTGKAEDEVVREALGLLLEHVSSRRVERLRKLRQAFGMWKDREDLPELRGLREGWGGRLTDQGDDAS